MASTFLTRLRVGGKLVDAKGVSRLYRSRISAAALLLLVVAAFVAIGAALAVSEAGRTYLDLLGGKWDDFYHWLRGVLLVISFRYHVVSIVAVFLALALGVVVGTTALNGPITTDLRNKVDSLNKQRAADVTAQAQLQQQVNIGNQFANTYAAQIVGDALVGDQVIMISMPNASSASRTASSKRSPPPVGRSADGSS